MSFNLNELKPGDLLIAKQNDATGERSKRFWLYTNKKCIFSLGHIRVQSPVIVMFLGYEIHNSPTKRKQYIISYLYDGLIVYYNYFSSNGNLILSAFVKAENKHFHK